MEIFKIEKKETLDSLLNLSSNFEFKNSMFKSETELIDLNQFKVIKTEIDSIVKYGSVKEKKQMFLDCPSKFYFISKPVFDKEYKTAVIDIQMGFTSLKSKPCVFKFENGTWKLLQN